MTDQLSSREAAALAGIAASTWRDYVAEGRAPQPDGKIGNSNWWYRSTVEEWKANRPGRGARTDLTDRYPDVLRKLRGDNDR